MARYALVLAGGLIDNIIEATPSFITNADPNWLALYSAVVPATADAEVGGTWIAGVFTRPARVIPPVTPAPRTLAGSAYTITPDDRDVLLETTSATPVTITIPTGLPEGMSVEIVQGAAGAVTVVGSGIAIAVPAEFLPTTAAQESSLVVTVLPGATAAVVRGDLLPA